MGVTIVTLPPELRILHILVGSVKLAALLGTFAPQTLAMLRIGLWFTVLFG